MVKMTYSTDRRHVLLWRYEETKSIRVAAKSCRVSKSTAQRWIAESQLPPRPKIRKVRRSTKINRMMPLVETSLVNDPFKTCLDLSRELGVSKELVRRCFHLLGFSCKRARYYGVSKNGEHLTKEFLQRRDHYLRSSHPIYSVDETGFGRFSYQYRKGWAPVGRELRVVKNYARQQSTSVLACCSEDGWTKTLEVKGGVKRHVFCEFIRSLDIPKGSVILMDNASIHKGDDVAKVFREKGFIRLYVPPYSPWFNPIEGCFSIVKRRYPVTQNINEAFCSLTTRHFSAFFKRSLTTYGVDECTSATNRSALDSIQTKPVLADFDRPAAARAVSGRRDAAQAVFGHPRPVQRPRGPSLTVELPRMPVLSSCS